MNEVHTIFAQSNKSRGLFEKPLAALLAKQLKSAKNDEDLRFCHPNQIKAGLCKELMLSFTVYEKDNNLVRMFKNV